MRLTGEQALALADLIMGPCMNRGVELDSEGLVGDHSLLVFAGSDEYLIHRHGEVFVAGEDGWVAWEAEAPR